MKHVTIKDVVRECGLSIATVSRVLGDSRYPVSEAKRALVLSTAGRLGYVPNLVARGLKSQKSNEIAVIIPSIQNPFYTSVIKGIEASLHKSDYCMMLFLTESHEQSVQYLINILRGRMAAGVIVAADSMTPELDRQLYQLKMKNDTPVILIDYQPQKNRFPGVFYDHYEGSRAAARRLIELGHRRIAFASREIDRETRRVRQDGFLSVFSETADKRLVYECFIVKAESDYDAGRLLAREVLNSGGAYTGIAAINDSVAVGLLSGLAQLGVKVPEDISVIGFDDCIYAEMCSPLLTTIHVPSQQMGVLAAANILRQLKGLDFGQQVLLKPGVTERESTAPPPRRRG